ncbi:MAG: ABC transporter substrate-binding protein [Bacteroidales bacterium]
MNKSTVRQIILTTITNATNVTLLALLLALSGTLLSFQTAAKSGDKIVLQLKWKHQFQFAGYYAALEKGFYHEVGLDVEIRDLEAKMNTIDEVLSGNATYGIANSELLVRYMNGDPVVALAPIFQSSPSAVVVRETSDIRTPQDFVGKSLEIDTNGSANEVLAMLYLEGVKLSQVKLVESTLSLNNLLNNKVDATAIYQSNEPYFLDKFGIPYRIIIPKNYGVDFYAECLFTSQNELRKNRSRVDKFVAASLKGWEYALKNPDEIAQLIQTKYKSTKTLDHLIFEAGQIKNFIQSDFIDIGHSNKGRWLHMAETLSQCGIITTTRSIDEFIHKPDQAARIPIAKYALIIAALLAAAAITVLVHIRIIQNSKTIRNATIDKLQQSVEQKEKEVVSLKNSLNILNAKAVELENFNDSLLANLSFEIRAPLNNIMGYCELINNPKLKSELIKQYTKEIAKSSRILQLQVDNLVELSKLKSNQYKLVYQRVNLYDFLNSLHVITLNELKLSDKEHISIKTTIDTDEINFDILSDRIILRSILGRLISNSVKYTSKGYIEIGCKRYGSSGLQLWVQDSGVGIEKQRISTIFKPFNSNTERDSNSNLGLGLPVAKGLVDLLNGKIWVESTKDSGTTVNITMPITPVGSRTNAPNEPYYVQQEAPNLKDKTILVVEDLQSNFLLLSKMLEETGCKIIHTKSGEDAINIFNTTPGINLVFMDLRLADMDGIEITRKIRLSSSRVVIVAQTAYSSGIKVNLSIEAGCNDFITKPISRLDLFNILRKYLSPENAI